MYIDNNKDSICDILTKASPYLSHPVPSHHIYAFYASNIGYPHVVFFTESFCRLLLTQALYRHIIGVAPE